MEKEQRQLKRKVGKGWRKNKKKLPPEEVDDDNTNKIVEPETVIKKSKRLNRKTHEKGQELEIYGRTKWQQNKLPRPEARNYRRKFKH